MQQCRIYPAGTFPDCKYVVIFSRYRGALLLSRHRDRLTWETQGGHIEAGEVPQQAACRELYEESGALESDLSHVFDYCVTDDGGTGTGAVFFADIRVLGPIPDSEMAEVRVFEGIPPEDMLTYPAITPVLYEGVEGRF